MLFFLLINPFFNAFLCGFFGRFFGSIGARIITTIGLFLNFVISIIFFYELSSASTVYTLNIGNWISSGLFLIEWCFYIDDFIVIMLLVVNFISFLVHLYSTQYMNEDPHIIRFMSYLSLFTFFMLILVTSDNFIQLFLGWEGVGLCSYLLISFWYTRIQANKSALKAIIVNRISDFCLTLGIIIIFYYLNTLDFSLVFALSTYLNLCQVSSTQNFYILTIISFLLFIGAVGKSAQIFLHTWLPDAMEGPTPVSALIHAATMVTAGVFLLIKCSVIFEQSSTVLLIVAFMGAITSVFAASSGLMLSDIKKVIAYSTCSQLGYMVFACGFSSYNVSLFHLMNHAIFKALLFLCAGAIIHSVSNEQDMRRMGGLLKLLPLSYSAIFVASLAITGFPFLTGFYSKDIILENAFGVYGTAGFFVHWIASLTAFFTAVYSIRILYLVFISPTNLFRNYVPNIHESNFAMAFPLILLGFGSIFIGYLFKDLIIGPGNIFLSQSIVLDFNHYNEAEYLNIVIKLIPLFMSFSGFLCFFVYIYFWKNNAFFYKKTWNNFLIFFFSKWQFDRIYNYYINYPILNLAKNHIYKLVDKGLLEVIGPFGFWKILKNIAQYFNSFQTGNLISYLFFMSLIAILSSYLLNVEIFNTLTFFLNIPFIGLFKPDFWKNNSIFSFGLIAALKKWYYFHKINIAKEKFLFFIHYKIQLIWIKKGWWQFWQVTLNDMENDFIYEECHRYWNWSLTTSYSEFMIKFYYFYIRKYFPITSWFLFCVWWAFIAFILGFILNLGWLVIGPWYDCISLLLVYDILRLSSANDWSMIWVWRPWFSFIILLLWCFLYFLWSFIINIIERHWVFVLFLSKKTQMVCSFFFNVIFVIFCILFMFMVMYTFRVCILEDMSFQYVMSFFESKQELREARKFPKNMLFSNNYMPITFNDWRKYYSPLNWIPQFFLDYFKIKIYIH